jgi:hypothetical protein
MSRCVRTVTALPNFGVIALFLFLHLELCPEPNSKIIRDISMKLCRLIDLIGEKCSAKDS